MLQHVMPVWWCISDTQVVHDYEHLGLTNDYLIGTSHPLAVRYNDRAPMENHHLAAAFTALRVPGLNFLDTLPKSEYERMRKVRGRGGGCQAATWLLNTCSCVPVRTLSVVYVCQRR